MIREMRDEDWGTVSEIYKQGLEEGTSTFNIECPGFTEWNEGHVKNCRFVFEEEGKVVGWIALSPSSSRCAYKGCVEMSVYVDRNYRGHGIGTALVNTIIKEAEKDGYWSIYSAIFSINKASIALHKKCGFREIGYRERIAKDRFGKWQNTTLMEYRAS
ncbi:GNAT family N-acetyltransferase [Butyrivibrio sp. AE3006]|uniref:GNAT family N-acetyltransferase n=1 Tax=Butyrivibrio sp. AE3006 TaxID=1280673 RepID=UPI000412DE73|nr:GNAT family N-acetyltransferase [Butyrivibrio sp. AE3006]